MARKRKWGREPIGEPVAAWGARAILDEDSRVDLVWDRQDAIGDETKRTLLCGWLDKYGLPELRKLVKQARPCLVGTGEFEHEEPPYRLRAAVMQSGGYLYIGAQLDTVQKYMEIARFEVTGQAKAAWLAYQLANGARSRRIPLPGADNGVEGSAYVVEVLEGREEYARRWIQPALEAPDNDPRFQIQGGLAEGKCCTFATHDPRPCVCARRWTCPLHGETHIGTHD